MSLDARFVNCPGCHADISDDREACPHCGTPVTKASDAALQNPNVDDVRRLTDQVVQLERAHDNLVDQVTSLTRENADLRNENKKLHEELGR